MKKWWNFLLIIIIVLQLIKISWYKISLVHENKAYVHLRQEVVTDKEENKNEFKINLETIKAQNKQVVGWIRIPETNINYPIMQEKDNKYYLNHNFNNEVSISGSIFMDYRNNISKQHIEEYGLDQNIILYGHNMKNNTMFGELERYKNVEMTNKNDLIIVNINDDILVYRIFAVYTSNPKFNYRQIDYSEEEFENFINVVKEKNNLKDEINISSQDKILTLSTCDDKERLVIHAKLQR